MAHIGSLDKSFNSGFMVFDWERAAKLMKAYDGENVRAGMKNAWTDFYDNAGFILKNGEAVNEAGIVASYNATPTIEIDGRLFPCFRWADESDHSASWTDAAVEIMLEA
jgi:hypothetical protein